MNRIDEMVETYLNENRQKVAGAFVDKGWKTDYDREIIAAQYDGRLPSGAKKFVDGFAKGDFKVAIIYDFDKEEGMVRVVAKRGKTDFHSFRMNKNDASDYEKVIKAVKGNSDSKWSNIGK